MAPSEDYGGAFEQRHSSNVGMVVVALKIRESEAPTRSHEQTPRAASEALVSASATASWYGGGGGQTQSGSLSERK